MRYFVLFVLAALVVFINAGNLPGFPANPCLAYVKGCPTPTPQPTIAPTPIPSPMPYWAQGGAPSSGDFGKRFLSMGACFLNYKSLIAELGNDEQPSFQVQLKNTKEYFYLCSAYQTSLKQGKLSEFLRYLPLLEKGRV